MHEKEEKQKESATSSKQTPDNNEIITSLEPLPQLKKPRAKHKRLQDIFPNDNNNTTTNKETPPEKLHLAYQGLDEFIQAEKKFVDFVTEFLSDDVQTIMESLLSSQDLNNYKKLIGLIKNFAVFSNIFILLRADSKIDENQFVNTNAENFKTRVKLLHQTVCGKQALAYLVAKIKPIKDAQTESNQLIMDITKKISSLTFEEAIKREDKNTLAQNVIFSRNAKLTINWDDFKNKHPSLCKDTIVTHVTNIFIICIQRVTRYPLPLNEILKHTPDSLKDEKKFLTEVISSIHNQVSTLNSTHNHVATLNKFSSQKKRNRLFAKSDTDVFKDGSKKIYRDNLICELANCLILYTAILYPQLLKQESTKFKLSHSKLNEIQAEFLNRYAYSLINIYLTSPLSAFEKIKLLLTNLSQQQLPSELVRLTKLIRNRFDDSKKLEVDEDIEQLFFLDAYIAEEFIQNLALKLVSEKLKALLRKIHDNLQPKKFIFYTASFSFKYKRIDEFAMKNINRVFLELSVMPLDERMKKIQSCAEQPNLASYIIAILQRELQPLDTALPTSNGLLTDISAILAPVFGVQQQEVLLELQRSHIKKISIESSKHQQNSKSLYAGHYTICRFLNILNEIPLEKDYIRVNNISTSIIETIKQKLKLSPEIANELLTESCLSFLVSLKKKNSQDSLIVYINNLPTELKQISLALFNNQKLDLKDSDIPLPPSLFECTLNDDEIHNYIQLTILQKVFQPFKEYMDSLSSPLSSPFAFFNNQNKLDLVFDLTIVLNTLYHQDFTKHQEFIQEHSAKGIKNIREAIFKHINGVLTVYKKDDTSSLGELQKYFDSAHKFLSRLNVKPYSENHTQSSHEEQKVNHVSQL